MIKNKFRILILNYEYPPLGGGAANATKYLLKEFAENDNIKIDLVTSAIGKYRTGKFSNNIKIHFLDIGKNKKNVHFQKNSDLVKYSWKAYWYCRKLIKKERYNLIHAFFGIPCGYIAMKLGLPYIVSLRGSDVPFYNERFKTLDKLIFKRLSKKVWLKAKSVIANSEGLKKLALKSTPEQKIEVIYNGVDTKEFKPNKNKKIQKPIKLISTGRLIKRKGYSYLIEALKGQERNYSLTLVGGGDERENLQKIAKDLKVNVSFLGEVEHKDIPKYLAKADIFVLPSLNEGMSNSVLEAMASGLPVITTDTGGSKELIKENGIIVKKRSSLSIKNALKRYQKDKKLIQAHGNESRKHAEKLSWKKIADKYNYLYSNLNENKK